MTTLNTPISSESTTLPSAQSGVASIILVLRLAIGWIFMIAGITKVVDPAWSAFGYLQFAIPEGNPFMGLWASMAGNPLIDVLNAWGALLVGVSLLLGVLTRWSAFWGIVMMLFYWASTRTGGFSQGFPDEFGIFIDQHIIFALILVLLIVTRAGRIMGFDAQIAKLLPQVEVLT